ncbi:unnamed protein product [Gadus morhua 'NCC']
MGVVALTLHGNGEVLGRVAKATAGLRMPAVVCVKRTPSSLFKVIASYGPGGLRDQDHLQRPGGQPLEVRTTSRDQEDHL